MKMTNAQNVLLALALPLFAIGCQQSSTPETAVEGRRDQSEIIVTQSVPTEAAPAVTQVADSDWTTLKGQFIYDGKAPASVKVNVNKDVEFCGKNELFDEDLVVGENGGIANVFIWLIPKKGTTVNSHPDYEKDASATLRFTNKNCRYEPHAMVVRAGQKLELGNDDAVAHNVNLPFFKNTPRNVMIPAKGSFMVEGLSKAEKLPTGAKCDIHPWMKGKLLIIDHPYGAVTDAEGNFEIKNLPAGEKMTFRAWHAKSGYLKEVEIDGKKTKWKRGRFDETLQGSEKDFGKISVKPKLFER